MSVTGTGGVTQGAQLVTIICAESSRYGGFLFPSQPNVIDFFGWLYHNVQIPQIALPGTSPWVEYALQQAIALVLCVPGIPGITYTLACYNCGTAILMGLAPDQPGQNYFVKQRADNGLVQPSTGLVTAASDESTSTTLSSPEWTKGLTVGQLVFYHTPWGREYLAYQQSYGPTIWGLT